MVGDKATSETEKNLAIFDCVQCGAPVKLRAQGLSLICVCASCGVVMDAADERHQMISQASKKSYRYQCIPFGTRGKLKGTLWEVIGYMEKSDDTIHKWSEYLLMNPAKGFRWITENDGHWNWIVPIKSLQSSLKNGIYNGNQYDLFHQGSARVLYVAGEFYWRVAVDDVSKVTDFVRDDEILSFEKKDSEVSWSIGEYLDPASVKTAFKFENLPASSGVAPNEPNAMKKHLGLVGKSWVVFLVLLFMIQILVVLRSQNEVVSSETFLYTPGEAAPVKDITTPVFKINKETSNVAIRLQANVDNSWLYVAGSLINVDTGEATEFDQGVEFYSGQDSDGSWSEGVRDGVKIVPSITGGNYQLNFEVSGDKEARYRLEVVRGVIVWENIFWSLGFLSIFPLFLMWRKRSFEMKRWSQSDYSPYAAHTDEDL